ncbi:hypothetical protein AAG565_13410 [Fontimonas sp. SYSU GA230001]
MTTLRPLRSFMLALPGCRHTDLRQHARSRRRLTQVKVADRAAA